MFLKGVGVDRSRRGSERSGVRRLLKTDYFRLELIISCALYKSVSSQLSFQNNSLSIYRHKPTQLCLTPIRLPHPRIVMGASCCSSPNGNKSPHASPPDEHHDGHEHPGTCGVDYDHGPDYEGCCDDGRDHGSDHGHEECRGDSDSSSAISAASTCCGSEERCDGRSTMLYNYGT